MDFCLLYAKISQPKWARQMTAGLCVIGATFAGALGHSYLAAAFLIAAIFTAGNE